MVEAVLSASRPQALTGAGRWRTVAGLAAVLAVLGGGWLWAEWGPLIAFDSLVSFCF